MLSEPSLDRPFITGDELPVFRHRANILAQLETSQAIVVESPTGSGKTTQLPRILYEAGYADGGRIGVTQPRRIAAVSVCAFIQSQLSQQLGGSAAEAAYKMRFEDTTTADTRIKVMTDGILLQEIKHDRQLSEYNVMLVDEAHERSLNIDFVLGLLQGVLARRADFKVIVSSATINAAVFSDYFGGCPIVRIETPIHPIEMHYRPLTDETDTEQLVDAVETTLLAIEDRGEPGDVLVFMSGEREIRECVTRLDSLRERQRWQLLPLYGRLPQSDQQLVFAEFQPKRKVVVATNIAETSITIPGVRYVVDSGLAKINSYNTRSFIAALTQEGVSRASCDQRRGRAGRTGPGVCYRLYSETSYRERPPYSREEIHRTDLAEVVLRMAELGLDDYEDFPFISHPGKERIAAAVRLLQMLDALDDTRTLTTIGEQMCAFPILPRHSRMVVEAIRRYPNVIEQTLVAAAFMSTLSPFLLPEGEELQARRAHQGLGHPHGDLVAYLGLFDAFVASRDQDAFCRERYLELRTLREVVNIKEQLQATVSEMGIPILSGAGGSGAARSAATAMQDDYLCAVGRGLIQFICVEAGRNRYRSTTAGSIYIHPGSVMFGQAARYIVAGEIVRTSRMYARTVSPLSTALLRRISPELVEQLHDRGDPREAKTNDRTRGRTRNRRGSGNDARPGVAQATEQQLGGQSFLIAEQGKRQLVLLPLEQAQRLATQLADTGDAGERSAPARRTSGMDRRGALVLAEGQLMAGVRVARLLSVAASLGQRPEVIAEWPRRSFEPPEDTAELLSWLPRIMQVAKRSSGGKTGRTLGFLCLNRADGRYWFSCRKTLESAAVDSMAAITDLARVLQSHKPGDATAEKLLAAARRRIRSLL